MQPKRRKRTIIFSGISPSKLLEIQALCVKHGTSFDKIPAWLLGKPVRRIEFYFRTIEPPKPPTAPAGKKAPGIAARAKKLKRKKKASRGPRKKKATKPKRRPKQKAPRKTQARRLTNLEAEALKLPLVRLFFKQGKEGLQASFRSLSERQRVSKLKKLFEAKGFIEKTTGASRTKKFDLQKDAINAAIEVLVPLVPRETLKKEQLL